MAHPSLNPTGRGAAICAALAFSSLCGAQTAATVPAAPLTPATPATAPAAPPIAPQATPANATPPVAPRPKIGLVLGGGGARGAAHIGVLEVLERLRIPVDCVAGTSMGALVAGAWAAGLSPAQMRVELGKANWNDMFQDSPDYDELNFRSKRLSQRFLPGSETGFTARGLVTPPGVVSGQKIKLFFNQLVHADVVEREMQALPLPVSIIATDIGNGQRVVLREGSLTLAMRASMSVPGLMSPQELGGRKLVDGGLVDNVPIREVRERCGAQVVIAVNVGSPLLKPEDVNGLLSVSAQMVALLTEQNVVASLATLKPDDIYIQPNLGTITAGDFDRHAAAAETGWLAAQEQAGKLARLSVDEASYTAWRQRITVRTGPVPRIDAIEIAGTERVNAAAVTRYLQQLVGAPLDTVALNRDLLRAFGDGDYERVDYTLVTRDGRNLLRVTPIEKSWGPDYLRLGLRLESNLSQGSTYQLRLGYQKTWLNSRGGELLLTGDLGSTTGATAEFYQPVDAAQRFFASAQAGYKRERADYFVVDQRIAEYRIGLANIDIAAGINFPLLGQLRAGRRYFRFTSDLETGLDVFAGVSPQRAYSGWMLALELDQADRLYFPRRGWEFQASYVDASAMGYSKLSLEARAAMPLGPFVFGTRMSWVDSPRGLLPVPDAARLGGFLNLSGYAKGQFIGDGVGYAHVRAERIIGNAPLGLRGDLRVGLALEAGRVARPYTVQKSDGWLKSAVVYLGGETPFGPVYLGLGQAGGGSTNAYLFIGTP
jgi:NTE family protein